MNHPQDAYATKLVNEIETLRQQIKDANRGAERNAHINRELAQELAALKQGQVSDKLEAALKALLAYTPRRVYRGGLGTGSYTPTGSALLKVIDNCDTALAEVAALRNTGA